MRKLFGARRVDEAEEADEDTDEEREVEPELELDGLRAQSVSPHDAPLLLLPLTLLLLLLLLLKKVGDGVSGDATRQARRGSYLNGGDGGLLGGIHVAPLPRWSTVCTVSSFASSSSPCSGFGPDPRLALIMSIMKSIKGIERGGEPQTSQLRAFVSSKVASPPLSSWELLRREL